MRKADYRRIANTYDAARSVSEDILERWLELISQAIGPRQKVDFLDIGCGTGRFSIPIARKLGYSVTGADRSEEMLAKAKDKEGASLVRWDVQDAVSLSYPDCSFDAAFMSHLLHHVGDPLVVIRECHRVLRPKGVVLNRYGAIDHIRDDPEHRFFPEVLEIDEARTPSIAQVEAWFRAAGLKDISTTTVEQQTDSSAEERLQRIQLKPTSALTLIPQSAFERGLQALQQYVRDNPSDPWLLEDRITLTTGRK